MIKTLSITEANVLRVASDSPIGGISNTVSEGRGVLAARAIGSLVEAGYLKDKKAETTWDIHCGRTVLYITTTATITDAGREALAVALAARS